MKWSALGDLLLVCRPERKLQSNRQSRDLSEGSVRFAKKGQTGGLKLIRVHRDGLHPRLPIPKSLQPGPLPNAIFPKAQRVGENTGKQSGVQERDVEGLDAGGGADCATAAQLAVIVARSLARCPSPKNLLHGPRQGLSLPNIKYAGACAMFWCTVLPRHARLRGAGCTPHRGHQCDNYV